MDTRPSHSGYFTAQPEFYDQLLQIERMQEQLDLLPEGLQSAEESAPVSRNISWLKKEEMAAKLGVSISISEYRSLITLLQGLWGHQYAFLVRDDLTQFLRPASQKNSAKREYALDSLGRSYATGMVLEGQSTPLSRREKEGGRNRPSA